MSSKVCLTMDNNTRDMADVGTVDDWNKELATELVADTACLAIYLIVGVLGNSLVLYVYAARPKLNNEDRFFIPVLAIIDLVACIVNCSFSMSINLLPVKYDSDIACKIMWFLAMYTTGTSAFTLMLIAIHRYLKLCKPFGRQMTHKWKKIFLSIILSGMILVALPCFAFYGSAPVKSGDEKLTGRRCTNVTAGVPTVALVYKAILFLLIFANLVVLVVLYSLIGGLLYKQARFSWKLNISKEATSATSDSGTLETDDEIHSAVSNHHDHSGTSKTTQETSYSQNKQTTTTDMRLQKHKSPGYRVTVMFMIIAVVFVLSFIPKLTMMLWESRKKDFWLKLSPSELGGYRFLYTFFIINNVVNPFIYGFFDKKFQAVLKKLICKTE